ncbi:ChaN family lipoprotein [Tritonibacter mobilis]|uniref:ChaN family lipoprotein n=1 Tax=Tritonibacter mobilis TaxID=379347 RepID=UPI0039901F3F
MRIPNFKGGPQGLQFNLAAAAIALLPYTFAANAGQNPDLAAVIEKAKQADIVLLGEVHDNPAHHLVQAEVIAAINPVAVVWEMLTQEQAELLNPEVLAQPAQLGEVLGWAESGWPEFSMYQPIFVASPAAQHWGAAVPRSEARAAVAKGGVAYFGQEDAARFGLDMALSEEEQSEREADQQAAHCNALPHDLLPGMVEVQRLRDASLARAALRAHEGADNAKAGPVVIVTGNGHARLDRGAPVYLRYAATKLSVFSFGQAEDGQIDGTFDVVIPSDPVARPDPCAAFN